ncbi:MAG: hypothetical protein F6K17_07990 [Okeania sp. SIO3C4]|nr:hypothetical protein [Okeania sp. SIO3B3]NER02569.1 hypothetical protein [Okeania sp. SIO3C4]
MNTYTLEEGRQRELKAAGAEGKERFKGRRFFITNYPDMILRPYEAN